MKKPQPLASVQLAPVRFFPRSVTLLGATGSIGTSTIDLLRQERGLYRVEAVTARRNAAALARLARDLGARFAAISEPDAYQELKSELVGLRHRGGRRRRERSSRRRSGRPTG